jgi:uncharacterized membrane protein
MQPPVNPPQSLGATLESGEGVKVERLVTVNRPAQELYAFWRKLENLPQFMRHLVSVTETGPDTSHWIARNDSGKTVEWNARIIEDKPGEMISWQSLPGSELANAGSVWFTPAPGERGTIVKIVLKYSPQNKVLSLLGKIFSGKAEQAVTQELLNFKSLMETGEIPTAEGQPKGN